MPSKTQQNIKRIVQVGLLIALAVVVRNFSVMLPIAGVSGLRISFGEAFTKIAAILFGPLYGGISSGSLDVIGFFLAGGAFGPYIPWITVDAVLGGTMTGLLWILAGKINKKWRIHDEFLKILIVTGIPSLIVSTLDSIVLSKTYSAYFLLMWIPRILEQVLMIVIQAYIITYLISIYKKYLVKT